MKKIYAFVIGLTVLLLVAASASAATGGTNNNIASRIDTATAHADVYTDANDPVGTEVGEVEVNSVNGDASIILTYRDIDPATNKLEWWYTFKNSSDHNNPEQMLQPYPLAKGGFVYGEDSAMVKAKQVPVKSTASDNVQYIDVALTWTKQPNGNVETINGAPVNGLKQNYNKYDAIATGSDGIFNPVYCSHDIAYGIGEWDCYFESNKGFAASTAPI